MAHVNRRDFLKTVSAGVAVGAVGGAMAGGENALFASPRQENGLKDPNPKSLLVRGKYVITNRTENVVKDGAVYAEGGKIVEVGAYEELKKKYKPELELGSDEFIVMPGLVNAHHHAHGITYLQSGAPDDYLEWWLKCYWWSKLAKDEKVPEDLSALYSYIRNLENGVTCVVQNDWYMGQDSHIALAKKLGIRVAYAMAVVNAPGRFTYAPDKEFLATLPEDLRDEAEDVPPWPELLDGSEEEKFVKNGYVNDFKSWLANHHKGRIKIMFGPFGVQWVSKALLETIKGFMKESGVGLHTHLLETRYQKGYALKALGKSPVEYLKDLGLLTPKLSCAHGVWLTEKEMDMIAEAGTTIVTNPSSNLRLQSGIAPVTAMTNKKINVALGMDGLTMADDDDMFAEMRLCKRLQHLPGADAPVLKSADVIRMATVNGAKGVYLDDKLGILDKGFSADIILVDLKAVKGIYMPEEFDIVEAVVCRAKGGHVRTAIVEGEVLMHDRKLLKVNKQEVEDKLRAAVEKPFERKSAKRRKVMEKLRPHYKKFYDEMVKNLKDEPYDARNSRT